MVSPGGVCNHLSERSLLLGVIRIPNTAFKANAGTEVATDVLFLQKRSPKIERKGEAWVALKSIETSHGLLEVNEYFARKPEMMLGRMEMASGQFGPSPELIGNLTPEILSRAIAQLPRAIYRRHGKPNPSVYTEGEQVPEPGAVKDGGVAYRDGKIVVRLGNAFEALDVLPSVRDRIRGTRQVRDAVRDVFRTQLSDADDQAYSMHMIAPVSLRHPG